ncbi:unnamed protein product [Ranitomeya imitator]|uniref:Uncharacterized protein n=1 Tax=Ranitomeya imitator TaxID=111125 RepID=A0ABN9MAT4_9NEOB|nr:unnamed protein product [Ranitomeya imitator]
MPGSPPVKLEVEWLCNFCVTWSNIISMNEGQEPDIPRSVRVSKLLTRLPLSCIPECDKPIDNPGINNIILKSFGKYPELLNGVGRKTIPGSFGRSFLDSPHILEPDYTRNLFYRESIPDTSLCLTEQFSDDWYFLSFGKPLVFCFAGSSETQRVYRRAVSSARHLGDSGHRCGHGYSGSVLFNG